MLNFQHSMFNEIQSKEKEPLEEKEQQYNRYILRSITGCRIYKALHLRCFYLLCTPGYRI